VKPALAAIFALLLAGCGRYADFTLPPLPGGPAPHRMVSMQPEPILTRGAPGTWDSVDVLNPSVARRGGMFFNFYSGFDGRAWRTGLATSPDGVSWSKRGMVLEPNAGGWEGAYIAANGAVLERHGEFWYWYQAGEHDHPSIGLARSRDGVHWRKEPRPVLDHGPYMSWDESAVGDPYALEIDGWLYLYYLGEDVARQQRLGLARSRDGVHWQKLRGNPLFELPQITPEVHMDERGQGEPAAWRQGNWYWMLFTGRDRDERRRLALARSLDGVHWGRLETIEGQAAWNRAVVCDPTVLATSDGVRLWFGGGDRPSPAENLDGAIGTGRIQ